MAEARRSAVVWAGLLALALVLPQLSKAFDIDDTIFLLQAEHLLSNPLGPYSFELNWSSGSKAALFNNFNPPLLGYYLAGGAVAFGFREAPLHALTGLFVLLFGWWTYLWASECGVRPALATVLVLGAPPLAASVNCMPDIPHVALGIGGLYELHRALGMSAPSRRRLLGAGGLLALAMLLKYPAVLFVALAAGMLWRRPQTWWVLTLPAAALAVVAAWQWAVHGETHFFLSQRIKLFGFWEMLGSQVLITGGLAPGACLLALGVPGWRRLMIAAAGLGAAGVACIWGTSTAGTVVRQAFAQHPVEFVTFFAVGGAGLALAASATIIGSRFERILGIWVLAGFGFSAWYPEFPAPRRLFGILPPLVILSLNRRPRGASGVPDRSEAPEAEPDSRTAPVAVRPSPHAKSVAPSEGEPFPQRSRRRAGERQRGRFDDWLVALLQALLAAWVASADYHKAGVYRDFVMNHAREWSQHTVWTLGHDGWQWYALRAGWQLFEAGRSVPKPGDLLVDPPQLVKQIVYLRHIQGTDRWEVIGVPEGAREPRRYGTVRRAIGGLEKLPPRLLTTSDLAESINVHGYLLPYGYGLGTAAQPFGVYEFE